MADMKTNLTKLISNVITSLQTELTTNMASFQTFIQQEMHKQIAEVFQTIQVLN